jgi:hypothetical protein
MIPKAKWKWFGNAAHYCGSNYCRFHLTTEIGKYVISSVGEYRPFNNNGKMEEIDYDRFYETMVFKVSSHCDMNECGKCMLPIIDGNELDVSAYNTAGDAAKGHMAMCNKWAKKR